MLIGFDASRAALANHTGTETYAHQLLLAMAKMTSADLRLRLYTHQPPQPANWPQGDFVETRVIPFPRLWTHLRLAAEISRHPPNVLFVPAHVLPLHCPVPAAVTVHDLGYLHYPKAHTPFQRRYLHWTTRRHAHAAQRIIADSQATKDDLIQHYHADAKRIHVVHLGVDPALKPATQAEIKAVKTKYGISDDYLLYLGTLQPRKNLPRLLEAFQQISRRYPLKLVLAGGKGWLYNEIFAKTQSLGLDKRVLFPGFIAPKDKAALLSGASVFIFPSLYEGFGLPVLEAMACGAPVLCGNTSSLPEIAGNAALTVDPHNVEAIAQGLNSLLSDAALRQSLTAEGFKRVQDFSWEKAAKQVLKILTSINKTSIRNREKTR